MYTFKVGRSLSLIDVFPFFLRFFRLSEIASTLLNGWDLLNFLFSLRYQFIFPDKMRFFFPYA